MSASLPFDSDRRAVLWGLASAALLGAGCGAQEYERRLNETKAYFEYLEQVNAALGRSFKFEGIEIRVPKVFEPLTPPPPPSADGSSETPAAEPLDPSDDPNRLGYFPNVTLEGVVGTWRANVRLEVPGQQESPEAFAYLHLLSNWQRWVDRQTNIDIEPTRYLGELANHLANVLNVEADTSDSPWGWDLIKDSSRYVQKKKVEMIPIELPDHNPPLVITFYRYEARDVHVALLLIVPRAIDPRERLEHKLKYTLETMKVSNQPPQKKSNKPAAGGF